MRLPLLAVVLVAALPAAAPAAAEPVPPAGLEAALARLATTLENERVRRNLPSLSWAVVSGERIVQQRATGLADLEAGTPATPGHVYRAGSITKVLVGTALLQLVERGLVRLDDPLATYVPEYRPRVPWPDLPPTTLRQLATHTSGLPRDAAVNFWMNDSIGAWPLSRGRAPIQWYVEKDRLLETLPTVELEVLPDGEPLYSNLGMSLLAIAVERAARQPFPEYVAEHVLAPLAAAVDLARHAGVYALPGGFAHIDVELREGRLWQKLREAQQPAAPCDPVAPGRFSCGLEFRSDAQGRVTGVSFALFEFRRER